MFITTTFIAQCILDYLNTYIVMLYCDTNVSQLMVEGKSLTYHLELHQCHAIYNPCEINVSIGV